MCFCGHIQGCVTWQRAGQMHYSLLLHPFCLQKGTSFICSYQWMKVLCIYPPLSSWQVRSIFQKESEETKETLGLSDLVGTGQEGNSFSLEHLYEPGPVFVIMRMQCFNTKTFGFMLFQITNTNIYHQAHILCRLTRHIFAAPIKCLVVTQENKQSFLLTWMTVMFLPIQGLLYFSLWLIRNFKNISKNQWESCSDILI